MDTRIVLNVFNTSWKCEKNSFILPTYIFYEALKFMTLRNNYVSTNIEISPEDAIKYPTLTNKTRRSLRKRKNKWEEEIRRIVRERESQLRFEKIIFKKQ